MIIYKGETMKSGNVSTDGQSMYSWRLKIGRTYRGKKITIDYRQRVSMSTSRHAGAAIEIADKVETPS